jgi:hemerythrin-like domain-containing protein
MYGIDTRSEGNAAWMEHQILDHVKQALRVTLNWQTPSVGMPRKLSSVRFTLQSFLRHLERLMNLEEQDGYMEVVSELKPNMQNRIERLEQDHDQFRKRSEQLLHKMEEISEYDCAQFDQACGMVVEFLAQVDQHDKKEIQLLQETLLCDEGGEG